ncbi:MAG: glycoside hydrolase family 13 protein [Bacteroidota bacterium]
MKSVKQRLLAILFLIVGVVLLAHPVLAGDLKISKVEPPNWWIGMKWQPLQLMVYGEQLSDVSASFNHPSLKITSVHRVANPSYIFLDVEVSDNLLPGEYTLVLRAADETDSIQYSFLSRQTSAGRHQGFDASDVIYLITPDRFVNGDVENDAVEGMSDEVDRTKPYERHGGDIQGMIKSLGYLQDLGVTALWPNPLVENNGRASYHGYAVTDLYRIDPRFGTNELFRQFVDSSHAHGLKVIMDHVNNHIGIRHPWVEDLPMSDWLNGSVENHQKPHHEKIELTDIHSDSVTKSKATLGWFSDHMPDLNQRNPFVHKYLVQNTLWWIEYSGIDGIREDTYPYMDQQFAADWCAAITREYPAFNIVGEVWVGNPLYLAPYQKGSSFPSNVTSTLPSVTDFGLFYSLGRVFHDSASIYSLFETLTQDFLYPHTERLVTFLDNHDVRRIMFQSREDRQRVKFALELLLTTRGIPQLYYGTEIGMVGGKDHGSIRQDFPGGFPGDERNAFIREDRTAEENELFDHTRQLLNLRKAYKAFALGSLIHFSPENEVYVYFRLHESERIMVIANNNRSAQTVDPSRFKHVLHDVRAIRNLMTGEGIQWKENMKIEVAPSSAGIYLLIGNLK